jgi:Ala-tRNA(Pro) deacylase
MRHDVINAHPLVNTKTTSLASQDLIKFLEATGHVPRITAVTGEAPAFPE